MMIALNPRDRIRRAIALFAALLVLAAAGAVVPASSHASSRIQPDAASWR